MLGKGMHWHWLKTAWKAPQPVLGRVEAMHEALRSQQRQERAQSSSKQRKRAATEACSADLSAHQGALFAGGADIDLLAAVLGANKLTLFHVASPEHLAELILLLHALSQVHPVIRPQARFSVRIYTIYLEMVIKYFKH